MTLTDSGKVRRATGAALRMCHRVDGSEYWVQGPWVIGGDHDGRGGCVAPSFPLQSSVSHVDGVSVRSGEGEPGCWNVCSHPTPRLQTCKAWTWH